MDWISEINYNISRGSNGSLSFSLHTVVVVLVQVVVATIRVQFHSKYPCLFML